MTSPGEPLRYRLSAAQRLLNQRQFKRVYQRGRRVSGQWMTLVGCFGRPQPRHGELAPAPSARLGLSVSKDHGGAVRRNKLKRMLREAFRLEQHRLPGDLDLVVIPRQRPDRFPLGDLRSELVALVERLQQQPSPDRRRSRRGGG